MISIKVLRNARPLLLGTLSVAQGSATNPTSATGSVVVRKGDLIYGVVVQQTQIDTTGVSDNLGNTYSFQNAGTDGGNSTGRAFYTIATVAGTLTSVDVANIASARDIVVLVGVLSGPFSAIDANPANLADDTSPVTCPATGVLSSARSVVVCWYSSANSNSVTVSASSPNLLAVQLNSGTVVKGALGYQQVAATTSVAPEFTVDLAFGQSAHGTFSFTRA